jgi:hypothetical protein
LILAGRHSVVQLLNDDGPQLRRDQVEGLFVHRAHDQVFALVEVAHPAEGVQGARVGARVRLEPLLQETGDGAFRRPDGTVEEDDPTLRPVALRGALEDVDQLHQGNVEPVDRVLAGVRHVVEEVVVHDLLPVVDVFPDALLENHVVDPLEGRSRHPRLAPHHVEVLREGSRPALLTEPRRVDRRFRPGQDRFAGGHDPSPSEAQARLTSSMTAHQ